jgi:hypothetical protein
MSSSLCKATLLSGLPCNDKAKKDDYCLVHHKKYVKKSALNTECPICFESLTNTTRILRCGHGFHDDCVSGWLCSQGTCPMCRCEINTPLHKAANVAANAAANAAVYRVANAVANAVAYRVANPAAYRALREAADVPLV